MKPFNIEKAKAGAEVCTRDGRKVRIICTDAKGDYPIVALVSSFNGRRETETRYSKKGATRHGTVNSGSALMLVNGLDWVGRMITDALEDDYAEFRVVESEHNTLGMEGGCENQVLMEMRWHTPLKRREE